MSESSSKTIPADVTRRPRRSVPPVESEVGAALRSVYEDMVGESVPAEMLDLLGKLD